MADGYRGVLGAFPYAFRASESWLFRSYVVVGGLAAVSLSLLFVAALVVLISRTGTVRGGSLTLSRTFFSVVGLLLVAPMVAPTLLVARRHRRGANASPAAARRYDFLLAGAGYVFLASLYVGLVATVPAAQQPVPTGPLAPAVRFLFDLPSVFGLLPPLAAAAGILLAHRVAERG